MDKWLRTQILLSAGQILDIVSNSSSGANNQQLKECLTCLKETQEKINAILGGDKCENCKSIGMQTCTKACMEDTLQKINTTRAMYECSSCKVTGVELKQYTQTCCKLRGRKLCDDKDVIMCSECFDTLKCRRCDFVTGGDVCVYCRYEDCYAN